MLIDEGLWMCVSCGYFCQRSYFKFFWGVSVDCRIHELAERFKKVS